MFDFSSLTDWLHPAADPLAGHGGDPAPLAGHNADDVPLSADLIAGYGLDPAPAPGHGTGAAPLAGHRNSPLGSLVDLGPVEAGFDVLHPHPGLNDHATEARFGAVEPSHYNPSSSHVGGITGMGRIEDHGIFTGCLDRPGENVRFGRGCWRCWSRGTQSTGTAPCDTCGGTGYLPNY